MFTEWVTTMFTLQLIGYTMAISSVKKIVVNEWLRLNNSGFLMYILEQLEHMVLGSSNFCLNALWKLHVDVHLDGSLRVAMMKSTCLRDQLNNMPKMIISLMANHDTTGAYVS